MWKKADRIAIVLIIVMMAMQLSLFKIFAKIIPIFDYSYNTPLLSIIYVLMEVAIYCFVLIPRVNGKKSLLEGIKSIWDEYYFIILELSILLFAIIITDVVTLVNGRLRITNILTHNLDYLYAFLALPITILLIERKWKWEDFVDAILYLTALSMVFRIFVMIYFGQTGVEFECITRESTFEGWTRDGRIRIMPPCFIMLIEPLAIYSFVKNKKIIKKIVYAFIAFLALFYAFYVWQSRMSVIFMAVGIGVMMMLCITSRKLNIARWSLAGLGTIGILFAGGAKKIVELFSMNTETSNFAVENRGHYYAYDIFWGHFRQNFLYGMGMNEGMNLRNSILAKLQRFSELDFIVLNADGSYYPVAPDEDGWIADKLQDRYQWLCDAGILYSLEPMGILIGIFFLIMFARGIYIYLKDGRVKYMAILPLALTATIMVCEISIDCFFTPIAFAVPFFLSIVEYVGNAKE